MQRPALETTRLLSRPGVSRSVKEDPPSRRPPAPRPYSQKASGR
jgi:hypothetical protein